MVFILEFIDKESPMLSYKKILITTDLSENSRHIAAKAKEIAEKSKANLYAVHVLEHSPVAYANEFTIPLDVNIEQTLEAHVRQALLKYGKKYNIPENNLFFTNGSVKTAVGEIANKIKADLIIVGSHSHHALDVLLGSHANAILHIAKCDVLVVKAPT